MDYKELGLKCGLEVHRQLATKHKLFCNCSAAFEDKEPVFDVKRKLRVVAGESGDIDAAAAYEVLKGRTFRYKVYVNESCAVELDEEPPHGMNPEAIETALRIAAMLNCRIPDSIEVMRKTVLDGSAISGFQRTALVGVNGWIETSLGRVGIENVNIEEDASQILKREKHSVTYGLNRLGIPLVEIGTAPDIKTPEQAKEAAEKIGSIIAGSGMARRGIGTIRQDLNVSIKGGTRAEIKGVQELRMIPKIIENEIIRQQSIIKKGKTVQKEVRRAEADGTTSLLRPLSGSARLYPETDVPPIEVTQEIISRAAQTTEKEREIGSRIKFLEGLGFEKEKARQILKGHANDGRIALAERLIGMFQSVEKRLVWGIIAEMPKDIRTRFNSKTENLDDSHFESVIRKLAEKQISKEAVPDILNEFCKSPEKEINDVIKSLGIKTISVDELRKTIRKIIGSHKDVLQRPSPEQALMGLVMQEVRGKIPGDVVMKVLKEELEKKTAG